MTSPANNDVTVRENTETVFICTTSGGLPAATVRWFKHRRNLSSGDSEITAHVTTTTRKTSDNLISVTSTLRYSPVKKDDGIRIYCTANNSVNTLTSDRQPFLNVQCMLDVQSSINMYLNVLPFIYFCPYNRLFIVSHMHDYPREIWSCTDWILRQGISVHLTNLSGHRTGLDRSLRK